MLETSSQWHCWLSSSSSGRFSSLDLNFRFINIFSSTAARVWNSLPTAVQSSESLNIFRRRLKTELFTHSYSWHRACQTTLLLHDPLLLSLQLFAVAATLKSIDYNVAMTFILNNNNNDVHWIVILMCNMSLMSFSVVKCSLSFFTVW